MTKIIIHQGDNRLILKEFPDASFDSCVCDPPYELGFMGKTWDSTGIAYDMQLWREVWRVLKPGAYLLAFGGARTYHHLTCAIEDAGFVIHPMIAWIFGSGFPKGANAGKAIDKAEAHATPLFQKLNGWFYGRQSLKPALEPICMAQKPPEGKMLDSIIKWGCGAVNVGACRISVDNPCAPLGRWPANVIHDGSDEVMAEFGRQSAANNMHWPGNRKEATRSTVEGSVFKLSIKPGIRYVPVCLFEDKNQKPTAARFFYCAKASAAERHRGCEGLPEIDFSGNGGVKHPKAGVYQARKKGINNHPTVKPLALMHYLVRLVMPPGGVVLDPFTGSGSTLIAAAKEGFDAVGIDLEIGSCEIAAARCKGHLGMLAEVEYGFGS